MHALPKLPCYLNCEFTYLPDAKISVMDRGFLFGDGCYEVIPVYGGRLFGFEQHMTRLDRSLAEMRIVQPHTLAQWRAIAEKLIAQYISYMEDAPGADSQLIYFQITRGVAMRDHAMLTGLQPTVFVMSNGMKLPSQDQINKGVACVTADDFRWKKAHIKSTSLLGAVFARQIGVDAGAVETIMFRDGNLSEAAASNVWVIKDGKLSGVLSDNLVLKGIRYGLIESLCKGAGIPFELRRISRSEVIAADELLISSASKEILPVVALDGKLIGRGEPGPIFTSLYQRYQAAKSHSSEMPFQF